MVQETISSLNHRESDHGMANESDFPGALYLLVAP